MADVQTSLRSAGWVSLWTVGHLVVQLAFQIALAQYFGASADMDAYVAAIALPAVITSIAVAPLGFAYIPVLSAQWDQGNDQAAWSIANQFLFLLVITTGALSTGVFLLARPLAALLYPGFASDQVDLSAELLMVLAWLIFANGLIAHTQAVHHAQKRFLTPAAAPLAGIATTVVLTVIFRGGGITAVAKSVVAGSFTTVILQLVPLLGRLRLEMRLSDQVRSCLRLMVPLVCGAAYYRLDPLIDRYLASALPVGSISHLGYASRVVTALLMISTSGLSIVAFPSFARQHARGDMGGLRAEVAHAMSCVSVIVVPLLIGLGTYSQPVVNDVFQRGAFTPADARAVSVLLVLYLGMVAGAAIGEITSKVLYALGDTRTPTIMGCVGFTLGLLGKFALVTVAGAAGIVAATSAYYLFVAVLLGIAVRVKLGRGAYQGVVGATLRAVCAAVLATAAVWPLVHSELPLASLLAAPVGGLLYLIGLVALGDDLARRLVKYAAILVFRHRGLV